MNCEFNVIVNILLVAFGILACLGGAIGGIAIGFAFLTWIMDKVEGK